MKVNQEVYFNPKVEVANLVLSFILKSMLKEGLIQKEDLFSTDIIITNKILESRFKSLFKSIGPEIFFNFSDKSSESFLVTRKLRYVDPGILNIGKLSDNCAASKYELAKYLTIKTEVYYNVPVIKDFS